MRQNFTVSFGCDSRCQNCKMPNAITHGFLECSNLLIPNITFFNRGVIPCETISFVEFPDSTCDMRTASAWYQMPAGFCEWDHKFQCAAESITIENCTCENCNASIVAENACAADPFGYYRQVQCMSQVDQCATLIMFADTTCTKFSGGMTAVCGACMRQDQDFVGFTQFLCDPVTQTVKFMTGCNSDCSVCTAVSATHPFNQCSQSAQAGYSIFNQGIMPCDAVTITVFNVSTCQAPPIAVYTVGQHECGFGEYFACSAHPFERPTFGGQIIVDQCPWGNLGCIGCNTTIIADGGCVANDRGGSQILFCQPFPQMCAHFVVNGNGQCTNFLGLHTPVCGQCTRFPRENSFTRVSCNMDTQSVTLTRNCVDPACLFCDDNNPIVHNFLQCSPAEFNQSMSVFNRGILPCNTLRMIEFFSPNCDPGSWVGEFVVAEGVCQFDHRFQCTPRSVTVENCSCTTCAAATVAEGSCTIDQYGMYRQYQCWMFTHLCSTLIRFSDTSCTAFDGALTVICDSCMKRIDPKTGERSFFNVHCHGSTQEVRLETGCDPLCLLCVGPTIVHPWNQCSAGMNGGSIYNQGIEACDAVEVSIFNNSGCTGFASDRFTVGTNDCGLLGEYFQCSAPAQSNFQPSGEIIFSQCDWHLPYCTNCTDHFASASTCNVAPSWQNRFAAHIATCNQEESLCVDFVISNNSQCTSTIGLHRPVCGQCMMLHDDKTYTLIQCNSTSQGVTVLRGCQQGCTSCTGPTEQHPFLQCSAVPAFRPGMQMSLFNRGLVPCYTVTAQEFSTPSCAAGSLLGTNTMAEGICEFDHRVQCAPNIITVQNCSCPTCKPKVTAGFCTFDSFGFFRQYTCLNQVQNCATLVDFRDNSCKNFQNVISAVCGSCMKRGVIMPEYSLVTCNLNSQSVTLSTGCDAQCLSCTNPNAEIHPFDACSVENSTFGGSMFNQGIGPCDAVEIAVHFDPGCHSPALERFTTGQHVCAFDEFITCTANPATQLAPENAVTWYQCPNTARNCMGCTTQTAPTGVCNADFRNPSQGITATCDQDMSTCAYLVLHGDSQCMQYAGIHAPVCNSCVSHFDKGVPSYFFIACSQTTQAITLSVGCNPDCSTCTQPNAVTHPYLACQPAYFNNSMSLFNRGLFSCATVTLTRFSSNGCGTGSSVGTERHARDICQFDHRVECLNTSTPAPSPAPPQGSTGGSDAGTGVGIAVGVIGAAAIAGFVVFKLKGPRARFSVDESAMNEAAGTRTAGGYGAVQ